MVNNSNTIDLNTLQTNILFMSNNCDLYPIKMHDSVPYITCCAEDLLSRQIQTVFVKSSWFLGRLFLMSQIEDSITSPIDRSEKAVFDFVF